MTRSGFVVLNDNIFENKSDYTNVINFREI